MCRQESLKNEVYVVSLSLIWAGLSSSLPLLLSLSWSIWSTGDRLQLRSVVPVYVLPHPGVCAVEQGPQPLGCRLVPVRGLLGTGPHNRR